MSFALHFTSVHCSWTKQVEQRFTVLQRNRSIAPNFKGIADIEAKPADFLAWDRDADPFKWTLASFDNVLAGRARMLAPEVGGRVERTSGGWARRQCQFNQLCLREAKGLFR